MRIFTDWNNPFGGSQHKDVCKTLDSGTLEGWLGAVAPKSADLTYT
jgi:hypothetical protein